MLTILTYEISIYCTTAQEDNAILESFLRAAKAGKLDFGRIMLMRTAANVSMRPSISRISHLLNAFTPSASELLNQH